MPFWPTEAPVFLVLEMYGGSAKQGDVSPDGGAHPEGCQHGAPSRPAGHPQEVAGYGATSLKAGWHPAWGGHGSGSAVAAV